MGLLDFDNLTPHTYKITYFSGKEITYTFDDEDNEYVIQFRALGKQRKEDKEYYNAGFMVKTPYDDFYSFEMTNYNRPFKILTTVSNIFEHLHSTYAKKDNINGIIFRFDHLINGMETNMRLFDLYKSYLTKNGFQVETITRDGFLDVIVKF